MTCDNLELKRMITMNRIEWVDVFKGLLIISMVVGHATGYFNNYIYQFHMAAFFFASGYTINLKKRSLKEMFYHKAYTLLLPYLTAFVLFLILYKFVWFISPDLNINMPFEKNVISNDIFWFFKEFTHGRVWISALGATWFLPVLFFSTLFAKLLSIIIKKTSLSVVASFALSYIVFTIYPGQIKWKEWNFDLAILALLFMEFGIIVREYNLIERINIKMKSFLFVASIIAFYYFANKLHVSMDWPSRKFGELWIDVFAVLNDVYLIIIIAQIIAKWKWLKQPIVFIGKNTMGILIFHFLSFKVGYFFLGESIENFLPLRAFDMYQLFLCVFISIFVSVMLWEIILFNPYSRFVFGQKNKS